MDSTRKTKTTGKKTGVATQHTGAATSNQRAIWNTDCNAMLIKCLEAHKRDGRMGSNSSWHNMATEPGLPPNCETINDG